MSTIASYIVRGKVEDFPEFYIHIFSYFLSSFLTSTGPVNLHTPEQPDFNVSRKLV